jgi:parallel beta-helix repeat protein
VDNIYGIEIDDSSNNNVANCDFTENSYGLLLDSSFSNEINYCHFNENLEGIYCYSSNNNDIYYNDFLFNHEQAYDDSSNDWDDGSKGNYWSDYYGVRDRDDDGIYNSPYYIPGGGNKDKYPLANEFEYPVALFTFSPSMVKVNESITFDASSSWDLDGSIVKYEWDFGDGEIDYGEIITHAYDKEGKYVVKLTVTDDDGHEDVYPEVTRPPQIIVDSTPPTIEWEKPIEGYLYIFDREIIPLPFNKTIIIGKITITVDANDEGSPQSGMKEVEFYIDGNLMNNDSVTPYECLWDETAFFKHTITIKAYDKVGNVAIEEMGVWIFNLVL